MSFDVVSSTPAILGEGPHWSPRLQQLSWADIDRGRVMSRQPETQEVESAVAAFDDPVSLALPTESGGFLIAVGTHLESIGSASVRTFRIPLTAATDVRCNDGAYGPDGCLWVGTMSLEEGARRGVLYRVDTDGRIVEMLTGLGISNGIGWSPDGRLMYHADSPTRRVHVYDNWRDTLRRPGLLVEIEPPAVPDGLCVDASGAIWVALWDGWCVRRYLPDGQLDRQIDVPVQRPTSVALGGAEGTTLFITTAREGLTPAQRAAQPLAGHVLATPTSSVGQPLREVKGM